MPINTGTTQTSQRFYLPKVMFYVSLKKSPLTYDSGIIEEMKRWFEDKCKPKDLAMLVEAGMSVAGSFAPNCPDERRFIVISKLVTYGYLFGDVDIDSVKDYSYKADKFLVLNRIVAAVIGEIEPETSVEKNMCDIYRELKSVTSEGPYKRHLNGFITWVNTMREENKLQINDEMSFDRFMKFRKDNSGYFGLTSIIECLLNLDIAPLWEEVREVYDEAYTHMILTNDFYSFRKDYYAKDRTNIIIFLTQNLNYTLQNAVNKVVGILNELAFTIHCKKIRVLQKFEYGSKNYQLVLKYCKAIQDMVAGNLLHSRTIVRYHGLDVKVPIGEGYVILAPNKTLLIPPI